MPLRGGALSGPRAVESPPLRRPPSRELAVGAQPGPGPWAARETHLADDASRPLLGRTHSHVEALALLSSCSGQCFPFQNRSCPRRRQLHGVRRRETAKGRSLGRACGLRADRPSARPSLHPLCSWLCGSRICRRPPTARALEPSGTRAGSWGNPAREELWVAFRHQQTGARGVAVGPWGSLSRAEREAPSVARTDCCLDVAPGLDFSPLTIT